MSTFSYMTAEEWAKRNPDILPDCEVCKGNRQMTCQECGGYTKITCEHCGHSHDCENCSGIGKVRCEHCSGEIDKLYRAQLAADKKLIENTRLIVAAHEATP